MNQRVTANLLYAISVVGFFASVWSMLWPTYYLTIFTGIISTVVFISLTILVKAIYDDNTITISKIEKEEEIHGA